MSDLETERQDAPAPERPRRRPRWLRWTAIGVVSVVVLAGAVVGGLYGYARWRFGQIHKVHISAISNHHDHHREGAGAGGTAPMNVLLVGSDTRAAPGNNSSSFGNTQQVAGQRADVIKVLHLQPGSHTISALSIPRDLLVTVPGTHRQEKINATFNNGPQLLVRTIEDRFDIHIDHYVLINFASFQNVVKALGGVKMNFPDPAYDTLSGLRIQHPGCQLLGPAQALALARSRHYHYYLNGSWHYDPTGDLGRIQRQDVFLKAVVQRASHLGLSHPVRANSFLSSVVGSLSIDDTWTLGQLIGLARHYHGFNPNALHEYVLPTTVKNNDGQFGDVLLASKSADNVIIDRFLGLSSASPAPAPSSAGSTGSNAGGGAAGTGGSGTSGSSGAGAAPAPSPSITQVPLPEPDHGKFNPTLCG